MNHLHDIFDKPWEFYNIHLHLDNQVCGGRISASEWDAGGYFGAEFANGGEMVLYVCFEEVGDGVGDVKEEGEEEDDAWLWALIGGEGGDEGKVRRHEDCGHWTGLMRCSSRTRA